MTYVWRAAFLTMMMAGVVSCKTATPHSHAGHSHGAELGSGQVVLKKSEFPALPCGEFSESLRAKATGNPDLTAKFFWGKYGGPGCLGGEPVDAMDWLFYQHDVAYLNGVQLRELRAADRLLIRQLKGIDPDSLTPHGRKYRRRAIFYFRMPFSRWIGKPSDVLARKKKEPTVKWE
jgi:hypothetical protein